MRGRRRSRRSDRDLSSRGGSLIVDLGLIANCRRDSPNANFHGGFFLFDVGLTANRCGNSPDANFIVLFAKVSIHWYFPPQIGIPLLSEGNFEV
jgi:hypothetical protein